MKLLRELLQNPLTKGHNLDDPATTNLREQVLAKNTFLTKIYKEWYSALLSHIPVGNEFVLELGSGAGFNRAHFPDMIRSDIQLVKNVHLVCDSQYLPFPPRSLKAILMINVLHHIQTPELFLQEADRCLRQDGVIAMIEPWKSGWSTFVYKYLHHESYDTNTLKWVNESVGPLSDANGALPWIIFSRDREILEARLPRLSIVLIKPLMPISYLLSGGMSIRQLMPGFSYSFWRLLERNAQTNCGMFAFILVRRTDDIHP